MRLLGHVLNSFSWCYEQVMNREGVLHRFYTNFAHWGDRPKPIVPTILLVNYFSPIKGFFLYLKAWLEGMQQLPSGTENWQLLYYFVKTRVLTCFVSKNVISQTSLYLWVGLIRTLSLFLLCCYGFTSKTGFTSKILLVK